MSKPLDYSPQILIIENPKEAEAEFSRIGCDIAGSKIMKDKAIFYTIKIKGLTPPQANIIKQEILSYGGEAGNACGTINCSIKKTDILICGTLNQYKKLAGKLKQHVFSLPEIGKSIESTISKFEAPLQTLKIKNKILDFKKRTYIMGILNVTPDSFSDGGKFFDTKLGINKALQMIKEGADIIDIGGESTKPGSLPISETLELKRVIPIVKAISKRKNCIISIDTQKSKVAEEALKLGAHIINDVSALRYDKKMANVIANYNAGVILMHMQGNPKTMQKKPFYNDVVYEIVNFLEKSIEITEKAGILSNRVIIDPGFGFGKTLEHNLLLLRKLKEFKVLGHPILVGLSRKSMIGKILNNNVEERLIGTCALNAVAILNGANIIRVHDVAQMKEIAVIVDNIKKNKERSFYGKAKNKKSC